jgi:hypothetical protein
MGFIPCERGRADWSKPPQAWATGRTLPPPTTPRPDPPRPENPMGLLPPLPPPPPRSRRLSPEWIAHRREVWALQEARAEVDSWFTGQDYTPRPFDPADFREPRGQQPEAIWK